MTKPRDHLSTLFKGCLVWINIAYLATFLREQGFLCFSAPLLEKFQYRHLVEWLHDVIRLENFSLGYYTRASSWFVLNMRVF